jgi:aryl-alcohol dehydrogenase-like predicted oxidoreductase
MESIPFAKTGESVSQFCLGAMLMGTSLDPDTSYAMLDRFLAEGGNFIDTADCYAWWTERGRGGESEELLGRWMRERRNRDQIFLATKGGAQPLGELGFLKDAQGNINWERVAKQFEYLSAPALRKALEGSLRRLRVETIDLYFVHIDDYQTSLEETLETLNAFVSEGKVRFIGCSNFHTWRLERSLGISQAHGWARYVAVQNEYSYLRLKPGLDLGIGAHTGDEQLHYLRHNPDVTLLAYSPLLKGIYEDAGKRGRYSNWSNYDNDDSRLRLEALSKLSAELGVSNHQLVLAWLLHHQPRVIPIVAASGMAQFEHNLQALSIRLSPEQMDRLNQSGA